MCHIFGLKELRLHTISAVGWMPCFFWDALMTSSNLTFMPTRRRPTPSLLTRNFICKYFCVLAQYEGVTLIIHDLLCLVCKRWLYKKKVEDIYGP